MAAISGTRRTGASTLLLLAACAAPRAADSGNPASPAPQPLPARPLAQVFILESAGVQPDDTALTLAPGGRRVIVLRRSAPDFGLFARIELGDSTPQAPGRASAASLSLRPRPGEYALDLLVQGTVGAGGTILFSYGSHFVAPAGARERYGSDIYFERELAIGRLSDNGQVVFLPTSRPASDMLSAPLPGPGRYLVAAPR
ncbi:MAG TPA: hypothetical protein VGP61_02790 [Gemmatimonadales bacterium]|jgi:hypothetical protein|nr:hypothetical protein [Gemmatimonadales bacterium]